MKNEGTPFTNAEDLAVMRMRKEKKSFKLIAEALSRTRNSIIGRWHRVLKKDVND